MSSLAIDARNTNTLWASVLVETLWRCGVRHAVVSPGSRSTPLTMAFARHRDVAATPVLDERSAAFFALGLARRSLQPVVLVCTSGTAGANYYPAIIEAHESGVPLLVLTADRPPEMRHCASGQTIDQVKLFGAHVNFDCELAVPEAKPAMLRYLRQTMAYACQCTMRPQFGPVQVNVPFRDPLAPVVDETIAALAGEADEHFFAPIAPVEPLAYAPVQIWPQAVSNRGVIIAGPDQVTNPTHYTIGVTRLAKKLGWPILADGVSPLRHGQTRGATIITAYDTILRNPRLARELAPRQVICLGDWPTSKVLRAWIEASNAEIVMVNQRHDNRDALHGRTRHLCASVEALRMPTRHSQSQAYSTTWRRVQRAAHLMLSSEPRARAGVFEGDVVATMAEVLPAGVAIFVASSMPVRDVEYFWPRNAKEFRFFCNRGANGIDGTLSTALGIAHDGAPTFLLTGDLAFLHDSNGLLLASKLRGALTIVVINNNGGGIFEHLPIATYDPPFEEFFAAPQSVNFAQLCAAHGVRHCMIGSLSVLRRELAKKFPSGVRVLEVTTDRKRDAAFRRHIFSAAAARL